LLRKRGINILKDRRSLSFIPYVSSSKKWCTNIFHIDFECMIFFMWRNNSFSLHICYIRLEFYSKFHSEHTILEYHYLQYCKRFLDIIAIFLSIYSTILQKQTSSVNDKKSKKNLLFFDLYLMLMHAMKKCHQLP